MPPESPELSSAAPDAMAADAVASQLADAHHTAGNTHCLNCGTPLQGPFCSACGQHDFDFHRSFRHVFMEALEGIFHFDGKFFRNLTTLLFQPGRLTREFNAGKRASQVPPFRLYIFTAFVFFLLAFSSDTENRAFVLDPHDSAPAQAPLASVDQALAEMRQEIASSSLPQEGARVVDRLKAAADGERAVERLKTNAAQKPDEQKTGFERWAEKQGQRMTDPAFRRELGHRFIAAIPKMLLFCLPLFALITRVLFRRAGQVYLQHLVLALHFHTFIFLWVMFRDGWAFVLAELGLETISGWVNFAGTVWLGLYPLLMLRRLFANSWGRTVLKTAALALAYFLCLALAFLLTAIALVLMM